MQRYRITLKPYRDHLVIQPLNVTQEMSLTDEQAAGIYEMSRNLIPDYDEDPIVKIEKWDSHLNDWTDYDRPEGYYSQQTYEPFTRGNYARFLPELLPGAKEQGITWDDYIRDQYELDEANKMKQITKRYLMIFQAYHYANLIYQFNTPEFLQGLMTAANWLGVDWHEWILDLHDANTGRELEIVE